MASSLECHEFVDGRWYCDGHANDETPPRFCSGCGAELKPNGRASRTRAEIVEMLITVGAINIALEAGGYVYADITEIARADIEQWLNQEG